VARFPALSLLALASLGLVACQLASNLPTHRRTGDSPAALLEGTLALDGSCLVIVGDRQQRWLPIWPTGFYLAGTSLMDESGIVAAIGDPISMGGGEYHEKEWEFLAGLLATPVPTECRLGTYWLASDVEQAT
jgi:hypothetical protein